MNKVIRCAVAVAVGLLIGGRGYGEPVAGRVTVVNKGFPGRNSANAMTLLETEVIPLKAQHAVVYFGMNDAMNSKNLLPLDAYVKNLRAIVARLKASGVKSVALVTINPVIEAYVRERHPSHPQRDNLQAFLASYDQAVRSLAKEGRLPLVDLRKLVEEAGGATLSEKSLIRCEKNGGGRDGVHLTAEAYARLGRRVFEVIGPAVKPGETVVCFGDSLTFGSGVKGAGAVTGESYPAVLQQCFDARR